MLEDGIYGLPPTTTTPGCASLESLTLNHFQCMAVSRILRRPDMATLKHVTLENLLVTSEWAFDWGHLPLLTCVTLRHCWNTDLFLATMNPVPWLRRLHIISRCPNERTIFIELPSMEPLARVLQASPLLDVTLQVSPVPTPDDETWMSICAQLYELTTRFASRFRIIGRPDDEEDMV
jgi:hypothetical protein